MMDKMSNAEKYHFGDFTTEKYRELVRTAKENYIFRNYTNFDKSEKFVLWRHDIDFSVHRAHRLAQIESEEGVNSTFFIHLHSEWYNTFEKEIFDLLIKIKNLGHELGLHFDTHFYGISNEEELGEKIQFEKDILDKLLGLDIKVFSFHNTTPFTMNCKEEKYGGLINTYADYFQSEVTYCSDSNGYWRYSRLSDLLSSAEAPRLHILTHPEWWQERVMSPFERIKNCATKRSENNLTHYIELLENAGNKNIDWEN